MISVSSFYSDIMKYIGRLFLESLVVGVVFTAVVSAAMWVQEKYFADTEGSAKYFISTFLAAALTHILFEVSGANKWYCENGAYKMLKKTSS